MQVTLQLSLKYFDCNFYVFGVELKHNALSIFSIIDTSCFMTNINKQQIITTTSLLQ